MTKAELIAVVARECRLTKKDTSKVLETLFDTIAAGVELNGRFWVPGFGVFSLRTRKSRRVRNPATNEPMHLPASKTIGFRPAKHFRGRL